MNWDNIVFLCLAIWALLFGLFSVTTIGITWGKEIMGFAALILGIVCIVRLVKGRGP